VNYVRELSVISSVGLQFVEEKRRNLIVPGTAAKNFEFMAI
jgi:hypothetical protein